MNKKPISLEDYACLLARSYALALGKANRRDPVIQGMSAMIGLTDPYKNELEAEHQAICDALREYECLECEVVDRVRELCPQSNWDGEIRSVMKKMEESIKTNTVNEEDCLKLESLGKPDWRDRVSLFKLWEKK